MTYQDLLYFHLNIFAFSDEEDYDAWEEDSYGDEDEEDDDDDSDW